MKLSEKIKHLMKELRLTQTQFGEKCGTDQSTVSRWVKPVGSATPGFNQMVRIAELANMTLEQFIKGTDYARNAIPSEVDLVGFVSTGAVVTFFERGLQDMEFVRSFTDAPPATKAIEIKDSSLGENLNGWLAYYCEVVYGVPPSYVGKTCIVWLADGRIILGRLLAGSKDGVFTITPSFAPPIYDACVVNVAKIINFQPKAE